MKRPVLNDAQEMAQRYPETFSVPSSAVLEALGPGSYVQVCPQSGRVTERFWVRVQATSDSALVGTIDQDCLFTHLHGLSDKDLIEFERRHIYKVVPPTH